MLMVNYQNILQHVSSIHTRVARLLCTGIKTRIIKEGLFLFRKMWCYFLKNGCFFGVRMSNTRCENSAQVFCDMVLSIVCGEGKMKYTENGWKKC